MSMKEAFEHFINMRQNKPAEFVAKYIDCKLRIGSGSESEDQLEDILDKVTWIRIRISIS